MLCKLPLFIFPHDNIFHNICKYYLLFKILTHHVLIMFISQLLPDPPSPLYPPNFLFFPLSLFFKTHQVQCVGQILLVQKPALEWGQPMCVTLLRKTNSFPSSSYQMSTVTQQGVELGATLSAPYWDSGNCLQMSILCSYSNLDFCMECLIAGTISCPFVLKFLCEFLGY